MIFGKRVLDDKIYQRILRIKGDIKDLVVIKRMTEDFGTFG